MFCTNCGSEINDEAVICPKCGCAVENPNEEEKKSFVIAFILNWFLGVFGAHRFYTGYIGIGIAQLLTLGGCGIWALVDLICMGFNNYKDANGKELKNYKQWLGILGIVITILSFISRILLNIINLAAQS